MDDVATLPFKETPVYRGSIGNFLLLILVAAGVFSEGQWFAVVSAESVCLISFPASFLRRSSFPTGQLGRKSSAEAVADCSRMKAAGKVS